MLGCESGYLIAWLVWEPKVARSSGRVVGLVGAEAVLPLRSAAAIGMVDLAVLLLRTSAIVLLISPLLALLLAFA